MKLHFPGLTGRHVLKRPGQHGLSFCFRYRPPRGSAFFFQRHSRIQGVPDHQRSRAVLIVPSCDLIRQFIAYTRYLAVSRRSLRLLRHLLVKGVDELEGHALLQLFLLDLLLLRDREAFRQSLCLLTHPVNAGLQVIEPGGLPAL